MPPVPVIEVIEPNKQPTLYTTVREEDISEIVARHLPRNPLRPLTASLALDRSTLYGGIEKEEIVVRHDEVARDGLVSTFLGAQYHIATEYRGDPRSREPDEYPAPRLRGHREMPVRQKRRISLRDNSARASNRHPARLTPQQIIDEIIASGLRGRGGAVPTGASCNYHDAPGARRNMSSATATKAIPARSWTA